MKYRIRVEERASGHVYYFPQQKKNKFSPWRYMPGNYGTNPNKVRNIYGLSKSAISAMPIAVSIADFQYLHKLIRNERM